jgi:hypothetical protein
MPPFFSLAAAVLILILASTFSQLRISQFDSLWKKTGPRFSTVISNKTPKRQSFASPFDR